MKKIKSNAMTIKEMRKILGYSQRDLATMLGVATGSVSRWENNRSKPYTIFQRELDKLIQLAHEKELGL